MKMTRFRRFRSDDMDVIEELWYIDFNKNQSTREKSTKLQPVEQGKETYVKSFSIS